MILELKTILGGLSLVVISLFVVIPSKEKKEIKADNSFEVDFKKLEEIDNTKTIIIDSLTFKIAKEKVNLENKCKVISNKLKIEILENKKLKDTINNINSIDTIKYKKSIDTLL